ncbi:hypothetical protein SM094_002475 [Cronobacter malonaticus]|nr:hypothetical protein [Cronobacter malonaticus]
MTDTAKLKAAAERVVEAYGDEWFEAGRQICTVHKSKVNLINLCNPAAVLELIAALESARADSSENAARIAELESQRKLAFSACNRWADKCRDAEKRVAELETRTVKLPPCVDDLHGVGMVMSADAVTKALSAAGINLETGGEGE